MDRNETLSIELSPTATNGKKLDESPASTVEPIENDDHEIVDTETRCGWYYWRPRYFQRFASPPWVLFWLCWAGALQGFIVNGCVNVVITTIERRYQMKSTETGLIAGGYDVASFILLVPVSYFGGFRSKPKFIAIGVLVLAFGALVFSSPYFFAGNYEFSEQKASGTCPSYQADCPPRKEGVSKLSNYKYVFFLGQFLHGAGAAPLYTLGCTYLDDCVPPRLSALYVGIYYTMAILGPGIGYILGSQFLQIYVDWGVDANSLGLTPSSNVWIGRWWLAFLIGASLGLIIAIPISLFPKHIPGSQEMKSKQKTEMHKKLKNTKAAEANFGKKLKDFPMSLKTLLTNPTFMFLNLAGASDGMLISALASFLPKIIEQQFNLSQSYAAFLVGALSIPGAGGGTFFGGYLVKRYDMKLSAIIKFCIICSGIAAILCGSFIFSCSTLDFAGQTAPYPSQSPSYHNPYSYDTQGSTDNQKLTLANGCNVGCSCSDYHYDPICGKDNVMYFSPCFAGCRRVHLYKDTKLYSDCTCLRNANMSNHFPWKDSLRITTEKGESIEVDAVRERCSSTCTLLPVFLVMIFLTMLCTFLTSMPSLTATLRCVSENQKSFALGIQWLAIRGLGTIPSPLIFGGILDYSCILWQKSCDESGSCLLYDNPKMGLNLLILALSVKLLAFFGFVMAKLLYQAPDEGEEASRARSDKNELACDQQNGCLDISGMASPDSGDTQPSLIEIKSERKNNKSDSTNQVPNNDVNTRESLAQVEV